MTVEGVALLVIASGVLLYLLWALLHTEGL